MCDASSTTAGRSKKVQQAKKALQQLAGALAARPELAVQPGLITQLATVAGSW
jgi:hypothetical protein